MSDLESKISELERELAVKKAFQAVKFVLPKNTPEDVAEEVQKRLKEVSESFALSKEQPATVSTSPFSASEIDILKMLAVRVQLQATTPTSSPAQIGTQAQPLQSQPQKPTPGGSSTHIPTKVGASRKGKIITTDNVRGDAKRFTAPDDELFIPNPENVDSHGAVSATLMKKGSLIKIPLEDIEFLD